MLNNFLKNKTPKMKRDTPTEINISTHENYGNIVNDSPSRNKKIGNMNQGSVETPITIDISSPTEELINFINSDLDSIDSESMLENLVKILNSIQEDIAKKFENSKYLPKIQEIFEKNFEMIINYFIRCLQHTDTVKLSVKENLANGISQLNQIIQSEVEDVIKNIIYINTNNNVNALQPQISNSGFVFDEEFVTLINSLSSAIKEYMKNTKACVKTITQNSDFSVDQIMISKSNITDILMQVNSNLILTSNTGNKKLHNEQSIQFKLAKEKISNVLEKLESLNSLRSNVAKNIKHIDSYCTKFYDDAKVIFKKLKLLHNEKLTEIQKLNAEYNSNIKDSSFNITNSSVSFPINKVNMSQNQTQSKYSSKSTEHFNIRNNKRKVESVSPSAKKQLQTSANSNSMINYSTNIENSYTVKNYNNNLNKVKPNVKRHTNLTKSSDHFSNKNNRYSYITNTNPNTTNPLNASCGNINNVNTSAHLNFNNEEKVILNNRLEELKSRNKELLEEIAKLHETYVNTQYENMRLKQENELLKNNFNYSKISQGLKSNEFQEERENRATPKPLENINRSKKSKSVAKVTSGNVNTCANVSNVNQSYHSNVLNTNTSIIKNSSYKFETFYKLSEMVILFIRQMSSLQEAISKKAINVKDLKKEFEVKKKELINFASDIRMKSTNTEENEVNVPDKINYPVNCNIVKVADVEIFKNKNNDDDVVNAIGKIHSPSNNSTQQVIDQLTLEFNQEKDKLNEFIVNLQEEIKKLNSSSILFKRFEDENRKLIKEINSLKVINETVIKENKKIKSENEMMISALNDHKEKAEAEIYSLKEYLIKLEDEISIKNSMLENKRDFEEVNELREQIGQKEKLISSIREDVEKKSSQINLLNNQITNLSEEVNKKSSQINFLNNQIPNLTEENSKKVTSLNNQITSINEGSNKKVASLNNQITKLTEEINKKSSQINTLNNQISNLTEENNKKVTSQNNQITKLTEENSKKSSQVTSLNNQIINLTEENSNKLTSLNNQIINLTEKNSKKGDHINSLNNQITSLNEENCKKIYSLNSQLTSIHEETNKKTNQISLLNNQNSYLIEDKNNQILIYSSKVEDLKLQINKLQEEISENKRQIKDFTSEKQSLEKKTSDLLSKIECLESSISSIENENSELKQNNQSNKQIMQNLQNMQNSQNSQNMKNSQNSSSEIENLKKKIEEYKSKTIPELDKKMTFELEKTKEAYENMLKEKEEQYIKEMNKLVEENNTISEEYIKLNQDISLRENELLEMREKNKKLLTNNNVVSSLNSEIEVLKNKINELEKVNKKNLLEIENSKTESYTSTVKNLYDVVTNKYKQLNNSLSNKNLRNLISNNRKSGDDAFIFDSEYLDIKEEDEDLNMYNSNIENISPREMTGEIVQVFEVIISRVKKLNEEKTTLMKEAVIMNSKLKDNNNDIRLMEQIEENKRLRGLFEECTHTIYEAIKSTAPNMFEEVNFERDYIDSKNSDKSPVTPSAHSEGDFIQKAVEMFKKYNAEINEENLKYRKELEECEGNLRKYKIMAEEYKSALDLAITRGDGFDKKENNLYSNNIVNTNPNSSLTNTKENVNNFTVDDLVEMNFNIECDKDKDFKDRNINFNTNSNSKLKNLSGNIIPDNDKLLEKEKEIKDLIAIQDDLVQKLALKDEELASYKVACTKLLSISNSNVDNKQSIPIEKYKIILEQFNEEQEKLNEMTTNYEVLKRDYDILKSRLSAVSNKDSESSSVHKMAIPALNLKTVNKSFNIKEEDQCGDYEEDEEEYIEKINKTAFEKYNSEGGKKEPTVLNNSVANKKGNSLNYFAMLNNNQLSHPNNHNNPNNDSYLNKSQHSGRSRKTENTFIQDAIKDTMAKFEEHEELLTEQLAAIKKELKETREEREIYKRKFEESITLSDGKKNEVLSLLKQAVEKLIIEITITPKIKEILSVILRVLDYSEEQIIIIFNSKDKNKKNFFNFFKG